MEEKELSTTTQQSTDESIHHTLPPKITKDNIDPLAGSTKGKVLQWVKAFVYTFFSALLIAFAAHSLITPNDFTIGGISGIAILANKASGGKIPQSLVLFVLNLPLVITSFFFVKKRFAILSDQLLRGSSICQGRRRYILQSQALFLRFQSFGIKYSYRL